MLNEISNLQNSFIERFEEIDDNNKVSALQKFTLELFPLLEIAEKHFSRDEIIAHLDLIRNQMRKGPLVQRSQDWPRGYQGDFETIEYVLRNKNLSPPNSIAYVTEQILLGGSICQQHRNKISRQANLVKEIVTVNPNAKIISIACGVSEDMAQCSDILSTSNAEVTLIDIDQDALNYSSARLCFMADRIKIMQGNIYKNIIRLNEQYDLVLLGGLFDYLNNNFISSILKKLQKHVNPGGKIFFTDIGSNPYKFYLEYFSNWILIERSENELKDLVNGLISDCYTYTIETDSSKVTYMIELENNQKAINKTIPTNFKAVLN